MRIQNQLRLIPLDKICVERANRQRTELEFAHIYDLALNIAQHGLLQNIGLSEKNQIVFGERRLTAFKLLQASLNEEVTEIAGISKAQLLQLRAAALVNIQQYSNWSKIPARLIKGTSVLFLGALEFIENVQRTDLPWQDKAAAAYALHSQALAEQKTQNETAETPKRWTDTQTAALLGISTSYFSLLVIPLRELNTASKPIQEKIQAVIKTSPTAQSAVNATKTVKERYGEPIITEKGLGLGLVSQYIKPVERETEHSLSSSKCILHADFTKWVHTYTGAPFNFIHCDFPYGINFNAFAGQSTSAATKEVGQYNDEKEVYWSLLDTLLQNRAKLLDPSSHIMFWYSQSNDDETRTRIKLAWPDAVISKFRLIWHCSDNSGLCPAPAYEGRRTYETAFQITLGKRKIATPVALSFASPRNEIKIHRSQKHLLVLLHYFRQFVDSSTRMLDPTCGSATSVIAAQRLGATHFVGLERDAETRNLAVKYFDNETLDNKSTIG